MLLFVYVKDLVIAHEFSVCSAGAPPFLCLCHSFVFLSLSSLFYRVSITFTYFILFCRVSLSLSRCRRCGEFTFFLVGGREFTTLSCFCRFDRSSYSFLWVVAPFEMASFEFFFVDQTGKKIPQIFIVGLFIKTQFANMIHVRIEYWRQPFADLVG